MTLTGHIQNGVVVLDGNPSVPEGAAVQVSFTEATTPIRGHRVQVPLVRTGRPGTLILTNDRIAEILEEEDIASARR